MFKNSIHSNTTLVKVKLNKKYVVRKTEQLFKYNSC